MNTISAIETRYNGYRFRSRLEARWAMFFDLANVPWVYEQECLKVEGEAYLPDFRLWGEVYHEVKSRHEWERIQPRRVYLAGKIKAEHEWRGNAAVTGEDRAGSAYGPDWREAERIVWMQGTAFRHVGPFSISDDHRGGHRPGAIHMVNECLLGISKNEVLKSCLKAIAGCDVLCAHINTADAFGTLVEIGYAAGLGKVIAVTIDADLAAETSRFLGTSHNDDVGEHDFWFVQQIAQIGYVVADAFKAREEHAGFIRRMTAQEYRLISTIGEQQKAAMTFGDPLDVATYGEAHEFNTNMVRLCATNRAAAERVRGHRFDAR